MRPLRYLKAPYAQFIGRKGTQFLVQDVETGRNFELSYGLAQLLETMGEAPVILPDGIEPDVVTYLLESGLILEETSDVQKFRLRPVAQTLFDLPDGSTQRSKMPHLFVGLPYARGNAKASKVHKAPTSLRNFCHINRVSFESLLDTDLAARLLNLPSLSGLSQFEKSNYPNDIGDLILNENDSRIECFDKIKHLAMSLFSKGKHPFFIGGDHSVTLPIVQATSVLDTPIQYVHIDAHSDNYSRPSDLISGQNVPHNHANFVSRLLELDHVMGVYQFGIRGFCNLGEQEDHPKLHIHTVSDVRQTGISTKQLPCDVPCYISIDIDAFDPRIAPGTNTGVDSGFLYEEFFTFLGQIFKNRQIVGIDLVEIEPAKDHHDQTIELALKVILFCLAHWKTL